MANMKRYRTVGSVLMLIIVCACSNADQKRAHRDAAQSAELEYISISFEWPFVDANGIGIPVDTGVGSVIVAKKYEVETEAFERKLERHFDGILELRKIEGNYCVTPPKALAENPKVQNLMDTEVTVTMDAATPWKIMKDCIRQVNAVSKYGRKLRICIDYGPSCNTNAPPSFAEQKIDLHMVKVPARQVFCHLMANVELKDAVQMRYYYRNAQADPEHPWVERLSYLSVRFERGFEQIYEYRPSEEVMEFWKKEAAEVNVRPEPDTNENDSTGANTAGDDG